MATEYTITLNEVLKDTLPELPGIVRSVALRELRLTLREFFEKSFAWTAVVKDVAVSTGETPIQVDDGDENTEVIGVLHVAMGNADAGYRDLVPLPARPVGEATANYPSNWYVTSNPDEFCLYPYLDVATTDDLTVTVALIPAFDIDETATTLPRQILLKYYDTIMDGFFGRVYAHPNKPYSAPLVAQQREMKFKAAIGYYAAQRRNGYNGAPDWAFPQNWRVARG